MITTYRGTVQNGVVVFDGPAPLADGTAVRVEPVNGERAASETPPGAPHFRPVGKWEGPPGEFERLLAEVQAARDADLDLERDAWK
jgi:hypothetical protein